MSTHAGSTALPPAVEAVWVHHRDHIEAATRAPGLDVRMGGWRCRIESNAPALLAKLRAYFAEFIDPDAAFPDARIVAIEASTPPYVSALPIAPPEPGKLRPKEAVADLADGRIVYKVRTGMVFAFGGTTNLAFGPCTANDNQIVNFVCNRLIQHHLARGALLAHASAVRLSERTLAIAGVSGAGKSTTALHMMTAQPRLGFVSNDRVLLARRPDDGVVDAIGVPKHPRINPGTILSNPALAPILSAKEAAEFRALTADALWTLEHKFDGIVEACYGPGRFVLRGPLSDFAVLLWRRDGGPPRHNVVDLVTRPELLDAIIKPPGVFFLPPPGWSTPTRADYVRILAGVRIHALEGGIDFGAATRTLLLQLEAAHA